MVLKNVKKNMVASGTLGQISEKKFEHPSSGYPKSEELECPLTKTESGEDMARKTTTYPTKWELIKDNIYRRKISNTQYEFMYRLRMEDGVGEIFDTKRRFDDNHQPFRTQRDAEKHRKALIAQQLSKTPQSINTPNLHTVEELWADYMKNRGSSLATNSLGKHDGNVRIHISPYFKKKRIEDITIGEVKNFIFKLRERFEYSTVRGILATMAKIWAYAKELHIIPRETYVEMFVDADSKVKVPNRPPKKEVKTFDAVDIEKCFEYAKTEERAYSVLLALTFYGGVRLSEALGIMWDDIDFETGKINIHQQLCYDRSALRHKNRVYIGAPKEHDRIFDAAPQLLAVLKEWKAEQEQNKKFYGRAYCNKEELDNEITGKKVKGGDFVLRREDGRLITTYEAGHFRERLQKNVFEDAHFHGMRRTLVTKLVDGGVPLAVVSEFIGHADTRTTEQYYLNKKKLDNTKLLEVMGKM